MFSVVPSNPVTPFIDKNMLQIVFISLMTGAGLLVLERKTETLRKLVQEGMDLFMEVIGAVCKLLPLYIYTSLTVFMWKMEQACLYGSGGR
jgi:Na+/H+-dicarboxylate symporter